MFSLGDKVRIPYISDRNPHNNQVGMIVWLHKYYRYPEGRTDTHEEKYQATIRYEDGFTENVGDLYRKGSGLVSEVELVEKMTDEILVYDKDFAERCKKEKLFDVATPQEVADLFQKNVRFGDSLFIPRSPDEYMTVIRQIDSGLYFQEKTEVGYKFGMRDECTVFYDEADAESVLAELEERCPECHTLIRL